jgi:hypothetical protein
MENWPKALSRARKMVSGAIGRSDYHPVGGVSSRPSTPGWESRVRTRSRLYDYLFVIIALLYLVGLAYDVQRVSFFLTDDYNHFYRISTMSFWGYVLCPIDHHVGPLHRLITYAIFKIAPLNYPLAVFILLVFSLLALVCLYRLLNVLHDSSINRFLIALYAMNVYLSSQFIWWCSGILRLPYVLVAILCIYHYLKYRRTSRSRHAWVAFALFIAGLGFFSKAVLIPVFLLAVDLCATDRVSRSSLTSSIISLLPFGAVSALYVILYRLYMPVHFEYCTHDLHSLAAFVVQSVKVLSQGVLLIVYNPYARLLNLLIGSCWLAFLVYTVRQRPRNAGIWLIGLGCIGVNYLMIAISPVSVFGLRMAQAPRYHYDVLFLVIIFLSLLLRRLPAGTVGNAIVQSVRTVPYAGAIQVGVVVCCAGAAWFTQSRAMLSYPNMRATRNFMTNLSAGMAPFRTNPPADLSFKNGPVPNYLLIFCEHMSAYSEFLRMFGLKAVYDVPTSHYYEITEEGRVRRVQDTGRPVPP